MPSSHHSGRASVSARRQLVSLVLTLMLGLILPASNLFKDLIPAAHAAPLFANSTSTVFINEIHYDNTGTDAGEFVEIAGPAGTSLSGYSIVRYNGSDGAVYTSPAASNSLSGTIPSQQGGYGTATVSYPANGIQNGAPDGVALVGPGNVLIQFLCYEGTFTAVGGAAAGQQCTDIGVLEAGSEPTGLSLQLTGTGTAYGQFTWTGPVTASPGAVNAGQSFGAPTPTPTPTATPTPTPTPVPTPTPTPSPTPTPTPVATNVVINELDADTPGADTAEFVELYDGGVGNTSLNGLVVVFYNGSNDLSYRAIDLDGATTNAAGYFTLLGNGGSAVGNFPNDGLQNGADAVALYAGDASSFPTNSVVTTANLFDAVVYDTSDADDSGLLVLLNAGQPQVDENGASDAANDSIGRCPNGTGGGRNTITYTQAAPSPGAANVCTPPPPPATTRTIPEIQGSGTASPYNGTAVVTTGIVTGRRSLGSSNYGFYIQDPLGDANMSTSDAVLVFTGSTVPTVVVGDLVQVTGTITEFEPTGNDEPDGVAPPDPKTTTEITAPTTVVLSAGNPLPAALDSASLNIFDPTAPSRGAELEKYEHMRVSVASLTVSQPTNNFGEFWGVEPPRPRPFREPGIEAGDPVPAADEGPYAGFAPPAVPIFDGNFERIMVDTGAALLPGGSARRAQVQVTTGTLVTDIVGPLDFAFNQYRIVLDYDVAPGTSGGLSSAVPVPSRTSSEFTVGHTNLENFTSSDAVKLQKASLVVRNVLRTPDILGLIEIDTLASAQALATKINTDAADPGVSYVAYIGETPATQDIGYLVNTARVSVAGVPVQYNAGATFTYCNEVDTLHDRPAYILEATVQRLGGGTLPVTVILNHTKSLIAVDSPSPYGTCGTGTEGARNREKRRRQAEDIADLIQSRQSDNLVVLGDLNAFDFNDGLADVTNTLRGVPPTPEQVVEPSADRWTYELTNLLTRLTPDQRYSYVFEGNAQTIDHVLVNEQMLALNNRFAYARVNADFSESYADDASRPERVSDHDAPVAYFSLLVDSDGDGVTDDLDNCPAVSNADQTDTDLDGQGDACDADDDGDGVTDTLDNCPLAANTNQADNDADGQGDVCDADDDNDGVADGADNCPSTANAGQANNDGDAQGDACDADDDNDGVADTSDAFPFDPNESVDTDGDGTGNNADTDDDNDGQTDADESACGSNPLSAASKATDTDGDNSPNCVDADDDNDGHLDAADNCPLVSNPDQSDFDGDGIGDACDAQTGAPKDKDQCKDGGWMRFDFPRTFKNQGDCIQFVNAGK